MTRLQAPGVVTVQEATLAMASTAAQGNRVPSRRVSGIKRVDHWLCILFADNREREILLEYQPNNVFIIILI